MRPMEDALILTRVARVMETMSSWERSWVGVPVRWGSCRASEKACVVSQPVHHEQNSQQQKLATIGKTERTLVVSLSTRQPTRPASPFIARLRVQDSACAFS
jgi:hypothetical protein